MLDTGAAAVGNASWLELLHAEVCWSLDSEQIDTLIIKGPSISHWLYTEGERESADVDLLIRPADVPLAVDALQTRGFVRTYVGTRAGEVGGPHSLDFWRTDPAQGRHGIDLHHFFPGIRIDPADAFELLWTRRVLELQAGVDVWFPDYISRALIIALHAARDPLSQKTSEDVRRAIQALNGDQRQELAQLAETLDAQPALRAGLETRDDMNDVVNELGLTAVVVPVEWVLASAGADRTASRLNTLSKLPWTRRPGQVTRWVFPTPALMRVRDPRAGDGAWPLTRAYVVRIAQGIAHLPRAVRELREAQRPKDARGGDE